MKFNKIDSSTIAGVVVVMLVVSFGVTCIMYYKNGTDWSKQTISECYGAEQSITPEVKACLISKGILNKEGLL